MIWSATAFTATYLFVTRAVKIMDLSIITKTEDLRLGFITKNVSAKTTYSGIKITYSGLNAISMNGAESEMLKDSGKQKYERNEKERTLYQRRTRRNLQRC